MRQSQLATLLTALVVAIVAGCGWGDEASSGTVASGSTVTRTTTEAETDKTTTTEGPSASQEAFAYAFDLTGTRFGCWSAQRARAANEPRCIYSAAYAGCYKGSGGGARPIPFEQKFTEGLREIYEQAVDDCG